MTEHPAEYLGDSVYVVFEGYDFVIYTDNGLGRENAIYLEPQVMEKLKQFYDRIRQAAQRGGETNG